MTERTLEPYARFGVWSERADEKIIGELVPVQEIIFFPFFALFSYLINKDLESSYLQQGKLMKNI
ncbi:MAG: hypothetical protein WC735_04940 [Candidatus Paceibacterota bacterium]|jgi:hypothetical protein